VKKESSGPAHFKVYLGIEKSKIIIQELNDVPSIEDNDRIKLKLDSFCRIRSVGSAYHKDLYLYGFLPALLGLQNVLHEEAISKRHFLRA